jgi:hypothetical protein
MPIYWGAVAVAGVARSQQSQQLIAAGLAALGWVVAAGIAWWLEDGPPRTSIEIEIEWDPGPSWQCGTHPMGGCYGNEWGCEPTLE